ncbi:MAG: hypothetical protein ACI3VA_10120 [Candidatus Limivicinus sp.]
MSEGGTAAAAETTAETDPAAAARQQQYQTEITAALRAGEYQRALALFKEFGNPNLRVLNEVQTLKAFGDYAAAMGYDVSPEVANETDGKPSFFGESNQQTSKLKQEWEEAGPPKDYDGVFDDFAELNLSADEKNALRNLQSLSASSGYEYCIIIADGKASAPMTSKSKNSVEFLLDNYPGKVTLLHSHTNATPLSASDLRLLLNEKVEKIGSIGYNGDVYIAYNNYGITPTSEEFDDFVRDLSVEVNTDMSNDPDFYHWSIPERNYMAIREQAYRIVRFFEWTMEGGRIDE